jgi:hypothetical protein
MFGLGMQELLIIAVIFFVARGILGRRGGGVHIMGPSLVLRKFHVNESAPDGVLVEIVGRASGVTAWLLTIMGFDAETSLKLSNNELSFRSSSLFGQIHQVAPLQSISSTHCGYSKPIGYLILGVLFVLGGFPGLGQSGGGGIFLIGLIIGGIFLIAYWLSKKMTISIETGGGMIMGLVFKRSVIENVPVDIQKAIQAMNVVNKKVIESQR